MTFSLLGPVHRAPAIWAPRRPQPTSRSAHASRTPAPGVGAVLTQHRTDPRLGPRGLELLASGCDAAETDRGARGLDPVRRLAPARGDRRDRPHRRVLGRAGRGAVRRGARPPAASRSATCSCPRRRHSDGRARSSASPATDSPSGWWPRSKPARLPAASARRCARPRCWSPVDHSSRWSICASTDADAPIAALRSALGRLLSPGRRVRRPRPRPRTRYPAMSRRV